MGLSRSDFCRLCSGRTGVVVGIGCAALRSELVGVLCLWVWWLFCHGDASNHRHHYHKHNDPPNRLCKVISSHQSSPLFDFIVLCARRPRPQGWGITTSAVWNLMVFGFRICHGLPSQISRAESFFDRNGCCLAWSDPLIEELITS